MIQAQIFIDADELKGVKTLEDFIIHFLIKHKIAGATVFRGRLGFGENQQMKRPFDLFSFDEIPLLITFIDEEDKVKKMLTELRKEWKGGLITTHKVEVWNK
jgi:PII-like signaling protein